MVKSNPYTPSLNAGEFSPRLAARTDFSKYPAGLETCLNCIPLSEGGVMRRAGTRFVAELKSSAVRGRIKRFEFSTTQAYVLELGERIMRFYRHQGQIVSGDTDASITNGTFPDDISGWTDQSAGSGSIAHDATNDRLSLIPGGTSSTDIGWAQQAVSVGASFDINEHILKFRVLGAPSDKIELRVGTTSTGNELIADAEVEVGYATYAFTPGDGNNTIYVQFRNLGSFRNKTVQIDDVSLIDNDAAEIDTPWSEGELYEVNGPQSADTLYLYHPDHPTHKLLRLGHTTWVVSEVAFQDGPYLTENATTTTLTPAAATGLGVTVTASSVVGINDGQGFISTDVGRLIRISEDSTINWGWGVIVSVTSTTAVKVDIRRTFTITTAELKWRLGAWSLTTGYPAIGAFYEQRQFAANTVTQPQTFWATQTADLENHAPDSPNADTVVWAGTVEDDDAFDYTISADEVETIRWMSPGEDTLAMGATSGEWIPDSIGIVLTPSDVVVRRRTKHGSANIQPVRVGNVVLFIQRAKRKIREFGFAFEVDGFRAPDMTRLAQHVTRTTIVEMTYQQEPDSLVWAIREDGTLISMTYRREEDVVGWARHNIGGSGSTGSAASFTILSGTAAPANQITSITVNGSEILAAPVTWTTSNEATAQWLVTIHGQYYKFPPGPDTKSKDISAENTSPIGLSFSSDGTKMYSNRSSGSSDKLWQYDLSTPGDVNTAVYNGVFFDYSVGVSWKSEEIGGSPSVEQFGFDDAVGHTWNADGTKLYFCDQTYNTIYEVRLTSAWDLSTATHTYRQRYQAGVVPWSMNFNSDGTKMFIFGNTQEITQHSLSTAYLMTSGASDGIAFNPAVASGGDFTGGHYSFFAANGYQFFVLDFATGTADAIYQYTMTTQWNLSTAVYDNVSFVVGDKDGAPTAMFIDDAGTNLYVVGRDTDTVYQWDFSVTLYTVTASGSTVTISTIGGFTDALSDVVITTVGDMTLDSNNLTMISTGTSVSESVIAIPGANGAGQVQNSEDRDEIWVTVERTINGATKRYIEVFERDFEEGDNAEDQYHADSIITYDGVLATAITGLDHLEGEVVKVLADGYIQSDKTVSSGSITLDTAASVVQVGLPYTHTIKPLKFEGGASIGTAVGKPKQIFGVTFVLLNSHTLGYGPDTNNIRTVDFRQASDLTDTATPLFTGEYFAEFEGDWKTDPRIIVQSDDPTSFVLLALAPEIDTRESRG